MTRYLARHITTAIPLLACISALPLMAATAAPAGSLDFDAISDQDTIAGLTVLVIDATRLVALANVVGDIPPAQLGQLGLPLTS